MAVGSDGNGKVEGGENDETQAFDARAFTVCTTPVPEDVEYLKAQLAASQERSRALEGELAACKAQLYESEMKVMCLSFEVHDLQNPEPLIGPTWQSMLEQHHEEALAEQEEKHSHALDRVMQEHAQALRLLEMEHEQALHRLTVEHAQALEGLQGEHALDLERLQDAQRDNAYALGMCKYTLRQRTEALARVTREMQAQHRQDALTLAQQQQHHTRALAEQLEHHNRALTIALEELGHTRGELVEMRKKCEEADARLRELTRYHPSDGCGKRMRE
jgi:hypothetical protein